MIKGFIVRVVLPAALFSFVMLVPEAYSAGERVSLCHVRGPNVNSTVLIEVSQNSAASHRAHGDTDPVDGVCPSAAGDPEPRDDETETSGGQPRVTLCHATGSANNPFISESVAAPAVPAHLAGGDQYPAAGMCPGGIDGGDPTPTPEPVTMLLFGAGLAGVGFVARRRLRRAE